MANVACYLKELDRQRDKLANTLTMLGIASDESEKYNSLVDKVARVSTGSAPVHTRRRVSDPDTGSYFETFDLGGS